MFRNKLRYTKEYKWTVQNKKEKDSLKYKLYILFIDLKLSAYFAVSLVEKPFVILLAWESHSLPLLLYDSF